MLLFRPVGCMDNWNGKKKEREKKKRLNRDFLRYKGIEELKSIKIFIRK